jgi:adenylyltransferase/sulfurtransferase
LGATLAEQAVRSGVGTVRLIDRDIVEESNLGRQALYSTSDAASHLPKAVALAAHLRDFNPEVSVETQVTDLNRTTIDALLDGVGLVLDGTDNFETRFLVNDVSLETGVPWIYAGVIGSHGQTMPIFPGKSACLRCLIDTPPDAGSMETCDTAGVLGPVVNVVASLEAALALKILSGHADDVRPELTIVDVWDMAFRSMSVAELRDRAQCPACHRNERLWLHGERGSQSTILCGRNAVQVSPGERGKVSLEELAAKLAGSGRVEHNAWLLRLSLSNPDYEITVFRDGRAIVQGTEDVAAARGLYARYIGA